MEKELNQLLQEAYELPINKLQDEHFDALIQNDVCYKNTLTGESEHDKGVLAAFRTMWMIARFQSPHTENDGLECYEKAILPLIITRYQGEYGDRCEKTVLSIKKHKSETTVYLPCMYNFENDYAAVSFKNEGFRGGIHLLPRDGTSSIKTGTYQSDYLCEAEWRTRDEVIETVQAVKKLFK